ncbi:MAG TPA: hypothetical protein VHM90_07090 [Phycisphaerae bacterium]|nr:hypothetical protein [Phycisphaerae bacterium]
MTHESGPSPDLTQALQSSKILVTVGADFRQLCPCGCGMPGMNAEIKIDVDLKIGQQSLIAMIATLYEVPVGVIRSLQQQLPPEIFKELLARVNERVMAQAALSHLGVVPGAIPAASPPPPPRPSGRPLPTEN